MSKNVWIKYSHVLLDNVSLLRCNAGRVCVPCGSASLLLFSKIRLILMTKHWRCPLQSRGNVSVPSLLLARPHSRSSAESCGVPVWWVPGWHRILNPGLLSILPTSQFWPFSFKCPPPVVDLWHWVRGSGRNPVACVFLARLCKAQNGFQAGEGGTWRAVKAWASAVTPALPGPDPRCSSSDPPPWTPTPRGCNLGVPCHRTSGGPGRKRLELLKRKGGNSVHEKKRKLFTRWADVWMGE